MYRSKNTGVHIHPARTWRFRDLNRYITHFDGEDLLTMTRNSIRWCLRLFEGLTHVR